jgi:hypothetical protein
VSVCAICKGDLIGSERDFGTCGHCGGRSSISPARSKAECCDEGRRLERLVTRAELLVNQTGSDSDRQALRFALVELEGHKVSGHLEDEIRGSVSDPGRPDDYQATRAEWVAAGIVFTLILVGFALDTATFQAVGS